MSSVGRDEIERIAELASIDIDAASLAILTEQIAQLLDYFAQLASIESDSPPGRHHHAIPQASSFRNDTITPDRAVDPHVFAPAFEQQLFAVPRLRTMEDE